MKKHLLIYICMIIVCFSTFIISRSFSLPSLNHCSVAESLNSILSETGLQAAEIHIQAFSDADSPGKPSVHYTISEFSDAGITYEILEKNAQNRGLQLPIGITAVAKIDGTLSETDLERIKRGIIKTAGAELLETASDEGFCSWSFYTPDLGRFVDDGMHKLNLQVAARYKEGSDQTYIYIASPLIYQEY